MRQRLAAVPDVEHSGAHAQQDEGRATAQVAHREGHLNEAELRVELPPHPVEAGRPLGVGGRLLPLPDVNHHPTLEQVQETRGLLALNDSHLEIQQGKM